MQSMHSIPTAPNSPAYSRVSSVEPHADVDVHEHDREHDHGATDDFSDFDMMSSIDSLPQEPWPRPGPVTDPIESATSIESSSSRSSSSHSSVFANHGFIMPSLPSLCEIDDDSVSTTGLVGRLNILVCGGASRTKLINVLTREILQPPRPPLDESSVILDADCEHHVCSSSRYEHNNVTFVDCAVSVNALSTWLDGQYRKAAISARQPGIDALIYVLEGRPDEKELQMLVQIQRFAAVIPVIPTRDPTNDENADSNDLLADLRAAGLTPFLKRVWKLTMELTPNYDMTASTVEDSGYRSKLLQPSELSDFTRALLGASGRARAHTSHLYARWVQAQLAVTTPEPPGALVVRVNLRKSLESIGNLDPLGLAHWCTMPRLVGAVLAGMAAAVGLSAAWAKLFPVIPPAPVQCHRHILFDNVLENWTQWLRI